MITEPDDLWWLRSDLGCTQQQFAERFGIPLGTVRDVEQGRSPASHALRLVLAAIEEDPALMERVGRMVCTGGQ